MTSHDIFRSVILGACLLGCLPAMAGEPVAVVDIKPQQGKLSELLRKEAIVASQLGKAPFVEIGATWCAPCKALAKSLGDPLMQDAFVGTYIIRLDLDEWREQLKPLGLDGTGVPVFFALDGTGRATGPRIDGGAWAEDTPSNMAPPLKTFFRKNGVAQ